MSEKIFSEFEPIENDVHFLILMLEQIWKATHSDKGMPPEQLEALQLKYRRGLMKIKGFLSATANPENILDYLKHIKPNILAGVTDETKTTIYKKLDLDFSVMLKKIKTESRTIQKKQPETQTDTPIQINKPAPTESNQSAIPNQDYTRKDLLKMVENSKDIKISALQRKQAKEVLSKFIQIIRDKNPQELSEKLEREFNKGRNKTPQK